MQKLSKDEMKKVIGGELAPPSDSPCLSCDAKNDSCPSVNRGTCSDKCTDKYGNDYTVCSGY